MWGAALDGLWCSPFLPWAILAHLVSYGLSALILWNDRYFTCILHKGKKKKRTHGLKRLYNVGLSARVELSKDEEDQERIKDQDLFGVHDLDGDEVFVDVTTGENVEHDATVAENVKELKRCLEIVPKDDDDVAIEATPISSKSPIIVDYKIYREGKKSYFKIIRADGNS
nr:hypothetical protein [Tanacetum cinerariifolium]